MNTEAAGLPLRKFLVWGPQDSYAGGWSYHAVWCLRQRELNTNKQNPCYFYPMKEKSVNWTTYIEIKCVWQMLLSFTLMCLKINEDLAACILLDVTAISWFYRLKASNEFVTPPTSHSSLTVPGPVPIQAPLSLLNFMLPAPRPTCHSSSHLSPVPATGTAPVITVQTHQFSLLSALGRTGPVCLMWPLWVMFISMENIYGFYFCFWEW